VDELTLTNRSGNRVSLTPVGAAMTSIIVPDRTGKGANVCADAGGSAGRIIGRYANRIARGSFVLDGTTYTLATNEGRNTLHGGPDGFSKRTWDIAEQSGASVTSVLHSHRPPIPPATSKRFGAGAKAKTCHPIGVRPTAT
jgi:aldose 1-epimerase